jgi:hypothetical protein
MFLMASLYFWKKEFFELSLFCLPSFQHKFFFPWQVHTTMEGATALATTFIDNCLILSKKVYPVQTSESYFSRGNLFDIMRFWWRFCGGKKKGLQLSQSGVENHISILCHNKWWTIDSNLCPSPAFFCWRELIHFRFDVGGAGVHLGVGVGSEGPAVP